jgi:hypothetical protein
MAKSKQYNYPVTMMITTGHIRPSDENAAKLFATTTTLPLTQLCCCPHHCHSRTTAAALPPSCYH